MKKLSLLIAVVAIAFWNINVSAQSKVKLAHINSNELMQMMPGVDTAQKAIENYYAQLEEELKIMYAEYEKKSIEFQDKQATMSQTLQQVKMKELQDLQTRIENFREQAQTEMQSKQEEYLKPIVDRAKSAIAEVAKEMGYTYVFDSGVGALLYQEDSDNIMELVKKKIGIK